MDNRARFSEHDKWQEEQMCFIRKWISNGHVPDVRIMVNHILFSIDFKTTRNVEKNSHDMYFKLVENGELVAIVYNDRPYEKAESGLVLAGWITDLVWTGPIPPSVNSRSNDPYYKISGGKSLVAFMNEVYEATPSILLELPAVGVML